MLPVHSLLSGEATLCDRCGGKVSAGCKQQQQKVDVSSRSRRSSQARAQLYSVSQAVGIRPTLISHLPTKISFWLRQVSYHNLSW